MEPIGRLIPVVQLLEMEWVEMATKAMDEIGVASKYEKVEDIPDADFPEFATRGNGGFMFFIDDADLENSMNHLGRAMGCAE